VLPIERGSLDWKGEKYRGQGVSTSATRKGERHNFAFEEKKKAFHELQVAHKRRMWVGKFVGGERRGFLSLRSPGQITWLLNSS